MELTVGKPRRSGGSPHYSQVEKQLISREAKAMWWFTSGLTQARRVAFDTRLLAGTTRASVPIRADSSTQGGKYSEPTVISIRFRDPITLAIFLNQID